MDSMKKLATYDTYRKLHSKDATLWMRLFMMAAKEQCEPPATCPELLSILRYVRCTGTILEDDKRFGYKMQPVIGDNGWESLDEWEREKKYMLPYAGQLAKMLKVIKQGAIA